MPEGDWVRVRALGIEWANEIIEEGGRLIDKLIELVSRADADDIVLQLERLRERLYDVALDYLKQMLAWRYDISPDEICINEEREECKVIVEYNEATGRFSTEYYVRSGVESNA